MHLLLSNDDGIEADGLTTLRMHLEKVHRVTVIAPDSNRSGQSHAITVHSDLHLERIAANVFSCNGTPTDCVHLGLNHVLRDDPPDMVISGINHGANLGDDTLYSGTVGAALEARFHDIPAIAISLVGYHCTHFLTAARVAEEAIEIGINSPLININVPDVEWDMLQGWQVSRLGSRHRSHPPESSACKTGFRIGPVGAAKPDDIVHPTQTDFNVIAQNKVSVTPLAPDLTAHHTIVEMSHWNR